MLKGGLVLIWELDMNLGPTLLYKLPTSSRQAPHELPKEYHPMNFALFTKTLQ